ncbi:MAG: D-alanyl-D-alanine carboxypeptidase family protein [Pseudomonadota bacterium]
MGAWTEAFVRPAAADVGAYLVFDMGSGEVIAQHQPSALWFPASVTKLMTAHVTLQAVGRGELTMRSPVRISVQASQQPPSKMGFKAGTVITIETALRIILTKSANDVSVALAEAVGGTLADFMARMNKTAADLGMVNTRYDNPHGLPNRLQVTTARDTAILMMDLIERFPDRADFFDMSAVRLGKQVLRNHNVLIRQFAGATGMKTGFICSSGFNIAASAQRDGLHLGAVVFGGLTGRERNERTAELLAKGFEASANGGIVVLNGFGVPDDKLAYEPVVGQRLPQGFVKDLAIAGPEAEVTDLKSVVCGNSRPSTRYDEGTLRSLEAFKAQRAAYAAWQIEMAKRETAMAEILGTPSPNDVFGDVLTVAPQGSAEDEAPPSEFVRALAGDALRTVSFTPSTLWSRVPVDRPALPSDLVKPLAQADFAPDGWPPRSRLPKVNPLNSVGLREPGPERPPRLPLTYLEAPRSIEPVAIRIGGAEATRPEPLSGTVVGGGMPPMPKVKPEARVSL